jgi:hypothetical protein
MRTHRPAEPLALYGDYPALYCLGAQVPSSKSAGVRRGVKRLAWAIAIVGFLSLASGGAWMTRDLWSPESSIATVVPAVKPAAHAEKPVR